MIEVSLDGITAEYLVESGVADSMRLSAYRPGGSEYNDREAMRWAISHRTGLFHVESNATFGEREIVIPCDSDGLDTIALVRLLDTAITYGGRRYMFHNLTAEAESYRDFGGWSVRRWIEVRFHVVG